MGNTIIKILRYIIFIPICFIAIYIINWGLTHLLVWFMSLSRLWFLVVIILFGGVIWGLFKGFASLLSALSILISPNKWFGFATISIFALINGIILCYQFWTLKDDFSGWELFGIVIITILIIELTFALIYGALTATEE